MSAELITVLLAGGVLIFAGAVKGMVGVGFPIVAMSILTIFLEPIAAVGLVSIPVLVTNAWQAFQASSYVAVFKRFWPLIITLVIGTWIGGIAVAQVNADILLAAIGVTAVIFSLFNMFSPHFHISKRNEKWLAPTIGLGTGVVGGLTTVHGPPVMMYLLALGLKKDEFVGAVGFIWFCGSIPMVSSYIYNGVLGPSEIKWSLLALIPAFLGLFFGELIRSKINQDVFKKILILVLFVIGVNLIRRAIF